MFRSSFFKKYLLPGFIFQSVTIGGGYGTGRELIEYFLSHGPLGGLLGMLLVSTVMWSIILALSFEFSRQFKVYDYRSFFRELLGRYWFLFEVVYFILLLFVLAVIGSAAGVIFRDSFGIPYFWGVLVMLVAVGFLTFKGSGLIENFLSFWSFLLYGMYLLILILAFAKFGPQIGENLSQGLVRGNWLVSGFKYALYNLGTIAAVFFCLRHINSRREAVTAGLIGGVIGIVPGLLFLIAVSGFYPDILPETIPMVYALKKLNAPLLLFFFQVILIGTLIETGTGFIHSVNQRIHQTLLARGRGLKAWHRPIIAACILALAFALSGFGLINLISKGYGSISWGFFLIFILPLLTIGVAKIRRSSRNN